MTDARPTHPWLSCVASLLLLLGAVPAIAAGAAPVVVNLGQSAILARAAHAFEGVKADHGWAVSAGAASDNVLLYVPAAGAGEGADAVRYKLNGEDQVIELTIQAASPLLSGDVYAKSFKALFVLFILAILVENGLALLFRWAPFYTSVDTRRVDPLVAFVLSLAFVSLFDLDITTSLLRAYTDQPYEPNWPGRILTAMIIAGGSAGVNRIFQGLGFRSVLTAEQMIAKPPPNEAWVSVQLGADTIAVGEATVLIGPPAAPALVGSINIAPVRLPAAIRYFLRNPGRFPGSGGYTVTPDTDYVVTVKGTDAQGKAVAASWGPARFAPRALVDLTLHPKAEPAAGGAP